MSKVQTEKQIEMLLPISGKRIASDINVKIKPKSITYDQVISSLRKKGLTKSEVKK
jgi:hypothetical protein